MRTANIGALKDQLSAYLRVVRAGEEVIICDRNVPIARLAPLEAQKAAKPRHGLSDEEIALASSPNIVPPKRKIDWDAFFALPSGNVPYDIAVEAALWAKGDR